MRHTSVLLFIASFALLSCVVLCDAANDEDIAVKSIDGATFLRYDRNKVPPIWPLQWNATLLIVNKDDHPVKHQWKKYYYDWTQRANRIDFYDHYFNFDFKLSKWEVNYTVLFKNNYMYNIYPLEKRCVVKSRNFGPVHPKWLQESKYYGTYMFRGMECDLFAFNHSDNLQYWQRSSDLTPVRQTNQPTDPGVTDYFDVVLGPQDPKVYEVPSYCPE